MGGIGRMHPALAFCAGFCSHFLLDAIPHWDYPLGSSTKHATEDPLKGDFIIGKAFVFDLIKIGIDFLIGLSIVFFFVFNSDYNFISFLSSSILWGALGGMVPDFLQFAYYKIKKEPLTTLQRFHLFMHTDIRLKDWHVVGPLLQIILIGCALGLYSFFY